MAEVVGSIKVNEQKLSDYKKSMDKKLEDYAKCS